MRTLQASVCLLAAAAALALPARAGDLADEADLHFTIAAERFRAHDYRGALEHFLASNRLVPNRNVVANIAHTYAQLRQYPEAFRYYTQALDGETDAREREALLKAQARIAPQVAIVRVQTEPPGATVFVDRKDLGPRGQTPAVLAFPKGRARVLVELEGHDPAEGPELSLEPGGEQTVLLKLQRVTGTVRVTGEPRGAVVAVEFFDNVGCALPCELQLPPGRRTLQVRKEGFLPGYRRVEVLARQAVVADFSLAPITGGLVVNTDERGASVEVDGRLIGFSPAVLDVPVGERRVRVTLPGFQPIERTVAVKAGEQSRLELQLALADEVSAASRTAESLEDAPSSVTVVSGRELRAMGYATVADAVRGVRGIFLNDDRTYESIGVRGFGPPGSYGNKILILNDGHATNDDWIGSTYAGFDMRGDLEDVERIEVVRGPGSVLYGTGAFAGVINLVPRPRDEAREVSATVAVASGDVLRARLGVHQPLGAGAGVRASLSGAQAQGQDFLFPQLAADPSGGVSRGADGFHSGSAQLSLWWKDLSLLAAWNVRDKALPTGEYGTFVGDPRTHLVDRRAFAEARFTPQLAAWADLTARAYVDTYGYDSTLQSAPEDGGLRREGYRGMWTGAELRLTLRAGDWLRVMAGGEGQAHLRVQQFGKSDLDSAAPATYLDQENPFQLGAGYLTADAKLSGWLRLSAGARVDAYSTFGAAVSPRAALILRPYARGLTKLMGGRAFRAPSIYELYYNDGGLSQVPACSAAACGLRPETIVSGEVEHTHRFDDSWSLLLDAYVNQSTDLIQLRASAADGGRNRYQNTDVPVRSVGGELELKREWRGGLYLALVYAVQRSSYVQDGAGPAVLLREVPNSPTHLATLKVSLPLVPRLLRATSRMTAESGRWDRNDHPGDDPQQRGPFALLWDLVLSGELPELKGRWSAGVTNLADWRWSTPVSPEFGALTAVPQRGRALHAELSLSY